MLRFIPRVQLATIILLIVWSIFSTLTSRVDASEAPAPQAEPAALYCSAWVNQYGTTILTGSEGGHWVYVDYAVRRNGCTVIPLWASCSAATSLVSVSFSWCGFYQPTYWNKTKIHVGANWQACSSPFKGWGLCWGEYLRTQITATGVRSAWGVGGLIWLR